MMNIAQIV